jgi:hypothetical protein
VLISLIVHELVHLIWNQGLTLTWELIGTVLYLQVDLVSWTRLTKDMHCSLLHVLCFLRAPYKLDIACLISSTSFLQSFTTLVVVKSRICLDVDTDLFFLCL